MEMKHLKKRRVCKRKKPVSEGSGVDAMKSKVEKLKFKVSTFNVIINQLNSEQTFKVLQTNLFFLALLVFTQFKLKYTKSTTSQCNSFF